nr:MULTISPECIES: hypothetical protein [Protofrankia]
MDNGDPELLSLYGMLLPVDLEDEFDVTADDEQGRGAHGRQFRGRQFRGGQFRGGQVGPAAAGDDGGDVGTGLGRDPQRGGAGSAAAVARRRRRCWPRSSRREGERSPTGRVASR